MYIHLGNKKNIREKDIIGIFDMDNTTVSKPTRDFLNFSEKRKEVINVSYELPKSFILTKNKFGEKLYISQLSPATLLKRAEIGNLK